MGQLSVFATAAIRRSLSSCRIPHSSNMFSTVWFPFPHGQSSASIHLNQCRYNLMFPWPVTIVVRFCVKFISFVVSPLRSGSILCCTALLCCLPFLLPCHIETFLEFPFYGTFLVFYCSWCVFLFYLMLVSQFVTSGSCMGFCPPESGFPPHDSHLLHLSSYFFGKECVFIQVV